MLHNSSAPSLNFTSEAATLCRGGDVATDKYRFFPLRNWNTWEQVLDSFQCTKMNSTYTCSLLVDMMLIGFRYERSLSFSMPSYLFVITFFTFVVPHLVRSFCPDRCVCEQNDVISVECINTNLSVSEKIKGYLIKFCLNFRLFQALWTHSSLWWSKSAELPHSSLGFRLWFTVKLSRGR